MKSLNFDGFDIKNLIIVDHRFVGDVEETILFADAVFLAGGNVPTQNKYFDEIELRKILQNFEGVLIGQSAGSMNCSEVVYAQPEEYEEFEDLSFEKKLSGLGLIGFAIMPHMNNSEEVDEFGHPSVMQMCLEDSFVIPHVGICDYGFIEIKDGKTVAYGKTLFIKNGKVMVLCNDKENIDLSEIKKELEN